MAETHARGHEYHLVDPSPWPIVGAAAAGIMAVGGILLMHDVTNLVFALGTVMVLGTMFVWWRDVIREATVEGLHTRVVQLGLRYGMALFIASEVMFFVAWFWAYFDASLFPGGVGNEELVARTEHTGGVWPPADIEVFLVGLSAAGTMSAELLDSSLNVINSGSLFNSIIPAGSYFIRVFPMNCGRVAYTMTVSEV